MHSTLVSELCRAWSFEDSASAQQRFIGKWQPTPQ